MRKNSATANVHPSLAHWCPFCGASPGNPCTARTGSGPLDRPHSRRIRAGLPATPEPERRQALCCNCGQLRTVSADYFARKGDPNFCTGGFEDKRGWRQTMSLKCDECGQRTRHALLGTPGRADWTENLQRFVLGAEPPTANICWDNNEWRDRLRAEYFSQFPRNPKLSHRYWVQEAKTAWAAGERTITSLCGAPMTLDFDPNRPPPSPAGNQLVAPDRIDWATEFEDPATGLWWVTMDCVDCLAVANRLRLKYQRKAVLSKLLEASDAVERLGAPELAALSAHLDELMDRA